MDDTCCRLCRNECNLISIFEELGASLELQGRILNRLHIYVDAEDYLPTAICFVCCAQLENFETFIKRSHETQNELLKIVQKKKSSTSDFRFIASLEPCPVSSMTGIDPEPGNDDEKLVIESSIVKEENKTPTIEIENDFNASAINKDCDGPNVEFTETDLLELLQSSNYDKEDANKVENISTEDEKKEPAVELMKLDKDNQIGVPLIDYQKKLEAEFTSKNPKISLHDAHAYTTRLRDKGEEISTDTTCDKGVQIKINCRYARKVHRSHWSTEQKKILKEKLNSNYQHKTIPSKKDIENFLKKAGYQFVNIAPDRVKTFFINRKRKAN